MNTFPIPDHLAGAYKGAGHALPPSKMECWLTCST
jgi:hypothetical protein